MESKELTVEEVLEIIGEICGYSECDGCPFNKISDFYENCQEAIGRRPKEVIKICNRWKSEHTPIETEWAYICRIIEDKGDSKKCVYEEDITPNKTNDSNQKIVNDILRKYCETHKGKFFAVIEHVCRVKGDG